MSPSSASSGDPARSIRPTLARQLPYVVTQRCSAAQVGLCTSTETKDGAGMPLLDSVPASNPVGGTCICQIGMLGWMACITGIVDQQAAGSLTKDMPGQHCINITKQTLMNAHTGLWGIQQCEGQGQSCTSSFLTLLASSRMEAGPAAQAQGQTRKLDCKLIRSSGGTSVGPALHILWALTSIAKPAYSIKPTIASSRA